MHICILTNSQTHTHSKGSRSCMLKEGISVRGMQEQLSLAKLDAVAALKTLSKRGESRGGEKGRQRTWQEALDMALATKRLSLLQVDHVAALLRQALTLCGGNAKRVRLQMAAGPPMRKSCVHQGVLLPDLGSLGGVNVLACSPPREEDHSPCRVLLLDGSVQRDRTQVLTFSALHRSWVSPFLFVCAVQCHLSMRLHLPFMSRCAVHRARCKRPWILQLYSLLGPAMRT